MEALLLKRNDLKGALKAARELLEAGIFTDWDAEHLMMLQDDQDGFIEALEKLEKELE